MRGLDRQGSGGDEGGGKTGRGVGSSWCEWWERRDQMFDCFELARVFYYHFPFRWFVLD